MGERITIPAIAPSPGILALAAERIIRQQRDDRRQICRRGTAEHDRACHFDSQFL
jgi:hypothetical protein